MSSTVSINLSYLFAFFLLTHSTVREIVASSDEPEIKNVSETKNQCPSFLVTHISDSCKNFARSIESLDGFMMFYRNFTQFNSNCLQTEVAPLKTSQSAELACERSGLFFNQVRLLAKLIGRANSAKPICTIEFAVKIYHFHQQIIQVSESSKLAKIFRLFANTVATRCRLSLAKRLQIVERRASDSLKFVNFLVGLMNIGPQVKLTPITVESFVPILERELPMNLFDRDTSSLGFNGYEFMLNQAVILSLDSARISCRALKLYHVNILGSLGLLASLSYASPIPATPSEEFNENSEELARIQRWVISAVLCQTLRNVLKISSLNGNDGEESRHLKIVHSQDADITMDDEQDAAFSRFSLPETNELPQLTYELLANFKFSETSRLNARKMQLLNGPNYQLSSAIYAYLNLAHTMNRLEMIEHLVGSRLATDGNGNDA